MFRINANTIDEKIIKEYENIDDSFRKNIN